MMLASIMAKLSTRVATRITSQLKRYQSVLTGLLKRDVSEADTVAVVNDMLFDICGYDKYLHVTSQYAIRGTYVDLAVKVDDHIRFIIDVKAIWIDLKDAHVKQAIDYPLLNIAKHPVSAEHGISPSGFQKSRQPAS
ncbi:hypothetical protein JJE66_15790 [Bradyrhizobium diazoefficiens]|uniref:hypothetical protein n=1 Tax=Bradyrhizobium diazoefficiens TaxID=1355477 RepID=UPI00190CC730|nr:hypothetical protein [Bradyrhizobium diazoefficiens]MBK3662694.1 hypothetical protein [Bradyrhizobium diazoefficiens]